MCSSAVEQKCLKDESLSTSSLVVEKMSNNADGTPQDGLPRSQEIANQVEKARESSARPRPSVPTSPKAIYCLKCKEIGHAAELCTFSSSQASGMDALTARSTKEETHKSSKLKDAIHAALLRKPEIYRNKKMIDQSDEFSSSNTDLNSEIACQDQLSVSNKLKNIISHEGTQDGKGNLGSSVSDSYTHTTVSNVMQHMVPTTNSVFPPKVGDSDTAVPSAGKPTVKDISSHASATSFLFSKISPIPEYEYIWQ